MLSNTWDAKHRYFVAYLPTFRLLLVIICYHNGKKNMLCLALKSRQMRRASLGLFRELQKITLRL